MKEYRFEIDLAKWEKQNDAYILDFAEGCLIDNFLYRTKRGYAAIVEHYLNEWSSCHYLYFSTDNEAEKMFYDVYGDCLAS